MSKLTDIVHEIVSTIGRNTLHDAIDELDQETVKEETSNAKK